MPLKCCESFMKEINQLLYQYLKIESSKLKGVYAEKKKKKNTSTESQSLGQLSLAPKSGEGGVSQSSGSSLRENISAIFSLLGQAQVS